MSSILAGILATNGPFTSSAEMAYSCRTGSVEVAASLSNSSLVSPSSLSPCASAKAATALSKFSPPRPSIVPGEKRARSSRICALRIAGLMPLPRLAENCASLTALRSRAAGFAAFAAAGAAPSAASSSTVKAVDNKRTVNLSGLGAAAEHRVGKREHALAFLRLLADAGARTAGAHVEMEVIGVRRVRAWPEHGAEIGAGLLAHRRLEQRLGGVSRARRDHDRGARAEREAHHVDGVREGVLRKLRSGLAILAAALVGGADQDLGRRARQVPFGFRRHALDPFRQRLRDGAGDDRRRRDLKPGREPDEAERVPGAAGAVLDCRRRLGAGAGLRQPLDAGGAVLAFRLGGCAGRGGAIHGRAFVLDSVRSHGR